MSQKVAFVIGASSGIGLATARLLAQNGYTVYGGSRREMKEKDILHLPLDVMEEGQVQKAFAAIAKKEGRLDVCIYCVGYAIGGPVEYIPGQAVETLWQTGFLGATHCARQALPMLCASQGYFITISSAAAEAPLPFQAYYSALKAGLSSWSNALALEMKPLGVKVVDILPGDIKTAFTQSRQKFGVDSGNRYGLRTAHSLAQMEKDEQNGIAPDKVAEKILRVLKKKNPPYHVTVGGRYRLYLIALKLLPQRLGLFVIGKLYG